jgi:putative Mg2+ transporter-C (MgtC) family protein
MGTEVILLQIFATFVLSMAFGLQRQRAHKPIGFGTFTFVAIGSCGLAIIGTTFGEGNPIPIIGSIVTGIGFLGAGALVRTSDKIFGFTTAASIWVFSIFGLLMGVGDYYIATIVYIFVWVVILIDGFFERNSIGSYQKRILFEIKSKNRDKFDSLLKRFNSVRMISIEADKKAGTEKFEYILSCNGRRLRKIIEELGKIDWIVSYKVN